MNQDEARKILGMNEGDTDALDSFTRRKKLITDRLNTATSESLKSQYRGMLTQLEMAAAATIGITRQALRADQKALNGYPVSGPDPEDRRSDPDIALLSGQTLSNRYRIREEIGRGNNGIVFSAFDSKRQENISIKVLYPELMTNNAVKARFLSDIKLASELYHPNIVNIFDVKNDGNYYFITMELLKGQSLRKLLDTRIKVRRPFLKKEVMEFINKITDGLDYASIKLSHKNLKPENIWIGEKGAVKIMDFGISPLIAPAKMSSSQLVGMSYLAPEQIDGSNKVDSRADQYALGAIIYELLTLKTLPLKKARNRTRHRKISKQFRGIINRLINTDANRRFQSIDQIELALETIGSERTMPEINRKILTLAVSGVVVMAVIYAVFTSGLLDKLEDITPVSAEVEKKRFDEAIALVNAINEHTKLLRQKQQKLRLMIREDQKSVALLETALSKANSDNKKLELKQQSQEVYARLTHNQQLLGLTDKIVYHNNNYTESANIVKNALSLIENKERLEAISLLKPTLSSLKNNLVQFNNVEKYLQLRVALKQARNTWADYNRAQGLLQPEDIEQRRQSIINAERLADQGKLVTAINQLTLQKQYYQRDYENDQKLVEERSRLIAQQEKTLKAENEWKSYLQSQLLQMTSGQKKTIEQKKTEEQNLISRQNFREAEATSLALQRLFTNYYTASKAGVAAALKKQSEERAQKARGEYEKALSAANKAIVAEDYDQAATKYKQALDIKPDNPELSIKLQQAVNNSSSELLKKYAPGMVLVKIPAGSFKMGHFGRGGNKDEKPQHKVTIGGFNLTKHEVTFAQYDIYIDDTGKNKPDDNGWGRSNRPVINVSWNEATAYAQWLSRQTGYRFRLPSEAEWEYAARANSATAYSWGDTISHNNANYGRDFCCDGDVAGVDKWFNTAPVGSFPENQFGLQDMYGNVWEWVQDCWNNTYNSAPNDGSAWLTGNCSKRVLRGGSWSSIAEYLRSANRDANSPGKSNNSLGFRLVQEP
jgi:formylglycine-generating enzyme required for sulfatase activity/serine/threonine protein kinase